MKKLIILCFLIVLTGCTANFDVSIKDNSITENVNINLTTNELQGNTALNVLRKTVGLVEGDIQMMGKFDIVGNKNSNPLKASIAYNFNEYDTDYALLFCYDNQDISYSNNTLKIQTSNYFNCFDKYSMIDNVNINVTTGYKVIENNADRINGNTYTWNITRTNKKGIKLILDTTVDEIEEQKEKKENRNKLIIILLIVFSSLLIIILSIIFAIKMKKNNEI